MHRRTFSRKTLGIPYAIFLLLFVAMPLLVLVYYAFTNGQGEFTVMNLVGFFTNPNTRHVVLQLWRGNRDDSSLSAFGLSNSIYSGNQQMEV